MVERHNVETVSVGQDEMTVDRQHFVDTLPWDEVARRLGNGASAIVPVGAGSKQHGLHLPMGTDRVQAEWFAARLSHMIDALVWPTVTYGVYPAFVAYPGSVSLSTGTFGSLIGEIVMGLSDHGARSILILDTGLSTGDSIAKVVARSGTPARIGHLKLHCGPRYLDAVGTLSRQSHGSHADEIETSIMLALAPDRVDMNRAEASPPLTGGAVAGPLNRIDPASPNYSSSGSFGDPTLASRDKGRVLIEAILQDLAAAVAPG